MPEAEPAAERIPGQYSIAKGLVSGSLWSNEEMDDAHTESGTGLWGTGDHVWRTSAGINTKTGGGCRLCLTYPSATAIHKARAKSLFSSLSPVIIMEDLYLQTFFHSLRFGNIFFLFIEWFIYFNMAHRETLLIFRNENWISARFFLLHFFGYFSDFLMR